MLTADYFDVPEEEIKRIESLLTVVDGKAVYAIKEFAKLSPLAVLVSPDWSPIKANGGHHLSRVDSASEFLIRDKRSRRRTERRLLPCFGHIDLGVSDRRATAGSSF